MTAITDKKIRDKIMEEKTLEMKKNKTIEAERERKEKGKQSRKH